MTRYCCPNTIENSVLNPLQYIVCISQVKLPKSVPNIHVFFYLSLSSRRHRKYAPYNDNNTKIDAGRYHFRNIFELKYNYGRKKVRTDHRLVQGSKRSPKKYYTFSNLDKTISHSDHTLSPLSMPKQFSIRFLPDIDI